SRRTPHAYCRCSRCGNRETEHGPHHPVACEAADGKSAKRVLPQRKNQGHSKRARTRRKERIRRTEKEDRIRRHAEGSEGQGHPGTQKTGSHAANVSRVNRLAQLSRLASRGSVE